MLMRDRGLLWIEDGFNMVGETSSTNLCVLHQFCVVKRDNQGYNFSPAWAMDQVFVTMAFSSSFRPASQSVAPLNYPIMGLYSPRLRFSLSKFKLLSRFEHTSAKAQAQMSIGAAKCDFHRVMMCWMRLETLLMAYVIIRVFLLSEARFGDAESICLFEICSGPATANTALRRC
jgi:hypothetical protein